MSTLELGSLQAELGAIQSSVTAGFSLIAVNADYASLSEAAAAGSVTFTLTQPISNTGVTIACAPLTVELDATGRLSVALPATDDANTAPPGVWYGVTEQIIGAQPRDYFIQVSATGPNPLTLTPPSTLPWR